MRHKLNLLKLKQLLNSPIKHRIGVIHTKVVKSKKLYSRKKKHKNLEE